MAKERIAYIDFMKGLCILLIVMGHVEGFSYDSIMPGLNYALKSFRIPMYFFLSGLFFKTYGEFSEFLRKKVNNLYIYNMYPKTLRSINESFFLLTNTAMIYIK